MLAIVVAAVCFILGMLGAFLPVLPGASLIWAGIFLFGLLTDFAKFGWPFLLAQGALAIAASLMDWIGTRHELKAGGSTPWASWAAALGFLIGPLVFGPVGFFLGPVLGVIGAELAAGTPWQMALPMGWRALVGMLKGALLKVMVQGVMIAWFFLEIT
ncbi:MAG: DUF456 domain-containing protein [Firmicutes bacterium]|jgi:uncharacterized protein YqgC (DUF456 family)|nr:DUF456 domain-containing protein [Bacillota bacterium]